MTAETRNARGLVYQPIVDMERVAQLLAHRACHSAEHDPANGRIHGYCVVCGVPWPCAYAGEPPASPPPPAEAQAQGGGRAHVAQQTAAADGDFINRIADSLIAKGWDIDPNCDGTGVAQLREAVISALAQQPAAEGVQPEARGVVDEGSRSVTRQLLHWDGVPVHVTGTVTTSPGNWALIDAIAAQPGGYDNDR